MVKHSAKILASEEKALITYFEGFLRNQPEFRSVAMLKRVMQTWPLFGFSRRMLFATL